MNHYNGQKNMIVAENLRHHLESRSPCIFWIVTCYFYRSFRMHCNLCANSICRNLIIAKKKKQEVASYGHGHATCTIRVETHIRGRVSMKKLMGPILRGGCQPGLLTLGCTTSKIHSGICQLCSLCACVQERKREKY